MKICCVFNYNPHYRLPIYRAMSENLGCDFFFGDKIDQPIKQFDPSLLKGFKGYISPKSLKIGKYGFAWYTGISAIFKRDYTHYIMTGSPSYILNWLILVYSKIFRKKTFLWCHGLRQKKTGIRAWYHRLFYGSADGIFMYGKKPTFKELYKWTKYKM